MQIEFNGEQLLAEEKLTLHDLLRKYNLQDRKGIAVAIDNTVVPRDSWRETELTDGKKIVVFTAAQGG